MQYRYDKANICQDKSTWEKLTDGRLRVPVTITRTGIFNYYTADGKLIRELRSDEEVLKPNSLNTAKGMYFTDEHPPELVDTINFNQYAKGAFSDVINIRKDGIITYIDTFLTIFDEKTQLLLETGKKEQISCGYLCDVVFQSGVWNGLEYDAYQKNIDYNHGSLVSLGRAGSNVKIRRDSQEINVFIESELKKDGNNNKSEGKKTMLINGREVKLDEAGEIIISQVLESKQNEIKKLEDKVKQIDSLEAKLLKVEKELEESKSINLDDLVDLRNSIISKASNYLKIDSFKGFSNSEIMKKAVISAYKDKDLSKKEDSFFTVAFDLLEDKPLTVEKTPSIQDFFNKDTKENQFKDDSNDLVNILVKANNKAYNKEVK